jgi:hypothetical protein
VLDGRGDDASTVGIAIGAAQPQDREIVAFRGAAGENQLTGATTDQGRNLRARFINRSRWMYWRNL